MSKVLFGIDRVFEDPSTYFASGERLGLICNQASVNAGYRYSADLFFQMNETDLVALFGPQHGIRGDVQDNMVESDHGVDKVTGLPVYSLYSETREPTAEMMSGVDTLVYDLQDIGGRVYTFVYTMANAMRVCARLGKRMVVLDRPNPINGVDIEGNLLESGHESFVGQFAIPMRHGMTSAELALMFNERFGIGCNLEVVRADNWRRDRYIDEQDAVWVMPSPNMPNVDTATVFPGTVFLEGTEVSEGRGTTRPFELVGAPFVDPDEFASHLNSLGLPGVYFRSTVFIPGFQKYAGEACGGVFLHVSDRNRFLPVKSGIAIVKSLFELYEDSFQWKQEPYEYEFERNAFDVIAGTADLRSKIENRQDIEEIAAGWKADEDEFRRSREEFLLYD